MALVDQLVALVVAHVSTSAAPFKTTYLLAMGMQDV